MFPEWTILMATLQALGGQLRRARDHDHRRTEAGLAAVEWVILVAVVVGIALAVGAVLRARIQDKARSIPLG